MAGRRRTGAIAGALDLAGKLYLAQHEHQRTLRERALEYKLKFDTELALEQYKRTGAYRDPLTGAQVGTARTVPSRLTPSGYNDSTGAITYARATDPSLSASRLGSIQQHLGVINALNQNQQALARPASKGLFGLNQKWLGASAGYQPHLQDTTALEGAAAGMRRQLIGDNQNTDLSQEVGDLQAAMTSGKIRTRQDAIGVIQAAGLDPNDPAFQDTLKQLQ